MQNHWLNLSERGGGDFHQNIGVKVVYAYLFLNRIEYWLSVKREDKEITTILSVSTDFQLICASLNCLMISNKLSTANIAQ